MPHQHVHHLTPYPHMEEGSAFPFPSVPTKLPTPSSSSSPTTSTSTSTSSSYAAFRYPRPHAASHPSASSPFRLSSTVYSPVPPSLLQRRRSSCSTVNSVSSVSSGESWGNWNVDSPPALSRSGSSSSRITGTGRRGRGSIDLKTPETMIFPEFEEEEEEKTHTGKTTGLTDDLDVETSDFETLVRHEEPTRSIVPTLSAMKGTRSGGPRMFVKLAEPEKMTPRLQRKQTPLVPFTFGTSKGLFGAQRPVPAAVASAATPAAFASSSSSSSALSTTTSSTSIKAARPRLVRKLTPHPATEPSTHLPSPSSSKTARHYVPGLSTLVLAEDDEAEVEDEARLRFGHGAEYGQIQEEMEEDEDEIEVDVPLMFRGRPLRPSYHLVERPSTGRRFSSVLQEGKVWLAI